MIDPSRLFTQLLNTGLQSKDNPLYQLIRELIGTLLNLTSSVNTLINNPASSTVNNFQTIIQDSGTQDNQGNENWPMFSPGGSGSGRTAAQVTASVSLGI
jgi:hypothetical protein